MIASHINFKTFKTIIINKIPKITPRFLPKQRHTKMASPNRQRKDDDSIIFNFESPTFRWAFVAKSKRPGPSGSQTHQTTLGQGRARAKVTHAPTHGPVHRLLFVLFSVAL